MKRIWIVSITTAVALYCFPHQDNFWAYISLSYYLSVCGLIVALFLSVQHIYQVINYLMLVKTHSKNIFVCLFYAGVLLLLFLFLPTHTLVFFFLFAVYQGREWKKYKDIFLLPNEQPNKEK